MNYCQVLIPILPKLFNLKFFFISCNHLIQTEMWPVWADDEYLVGFVKFMQVKYFFFFIIIYNRQVGNRVNFQGSEQYAQNVYLFSNKICFDPMAYLSTYLVIHGINSDQEAKLPKIFKNGSVSQWLLYKGKKIYPIFFA